MLHVLGMAMVCFACSWLACCRPLLYARYREAFTFATGLYAAWWHVSTALLGRCREMRKHNGSAALLLLLTVMNQGSIWTAAYALHGRLLFAINVVALPLLAVPALARTRRLCEETLAWPGVEAPLGRAFSGLSLAQ